MYDGFVKIFFVNSQIVSIFAFHVTVENVEYTEKIFLYILIHQ